MPTPKAELHSPTLVSGFMLGLMLGAIMALLWPRRELPASVVAPKPITSPRAARPTVSYNPIPEIARMLPEPEPDPVQLSRERGQRAARQRRAELGLE
jgi:hypothetical protein